MDMQSSIGQAFQVTKSIEALSNHNSRLSTSKITQPEKVKIIKSWCGGKVSRLLSRILIKAD